MSRPLLLGSFGRRLPYDWAPFAKRFRMAREFIGPRFFRSLADALDGEVTRASELNRHVGVTDDFIGFGTADFDAAEVAPIIRQFYERTSEFKLTVSTEMNPLFKPLYRAFIAPRLKAMGQLNVPVDVKDQELDSWIELIDVDGDGEPDHKGWVRMVPGSAAPLQVGAYEFYKSSTNGRQVSHIAAVMPLPRGNLAAVFALSNLENGGMQMSTRDGRSRQAGVYKVSPGKHCFSMRPSVSSEVFKMVPQGESIEVTGDTRVLGIPAFKLNYTISRKDRASAGDRPGQLAGRLRDSAPRVA